jgi:hypothetical protein
MIFLEQPSVLNGKTYPADERTSELFCTVAQQPENRKLTISRPNGNFTYNFSGRSGSSALAFNIQQPGTYHFECHYPSGATEPQAVVAVGTGVAALIFGVVFRGLAALFATIACCAAVSVLIYVLREQSKKNLMREAQREYQAQLARAAQPPFTGIPPAGNP